MAVDKTLEIDLSNLNEAGLAKLDEQFGIFEENLKKVGRKSTKPKQKKILKKEITKETEQSDKKTKKQLLKQQKLQERENRQILDQFTKLQGTANPAAILSQIKNAAPVLAPLFIATGLFTDAILKSDEIAKRFVDSADNRINIFVSLQEQALVDNSLQQVIYTTEAGGTSPRDSYNTFNLYDRQVTQDGINTDLNDIGSLD